MMCFRFKLYKNKNIEFFFIYIWMFKFYLKFEKRIIARFNRKFIDLFLRDRCVCLRQEILPNARYDMILEYDFHL